MIWVLDASVAVRWFLKDETHPNADKVLRRLIDSPESFAVPELFCFEVYAVLCRMHPSGDRIFGEGVIPLLNGGIFRQPMSERLAKKAAGFVKKGLSGYDACYAALAREMAGRWLTFDAAAHKCVVREKVSHLLTRQLPQNWP
jgi:predicted nucleic acid-binding protein